MRIHKHLLALIAVILVGVTQSASAIPVQWTLNSWNLDGGGTATGSFVYDVDVGTNGTFSNVNITSTLGPSSFTFAGGNADANNLEFFMLDPGSDDLTFTEVLLAQIGGGGMTNAGGGPLFVLTEKDNNPLSSQSTCDNADCTTVSDPVFLTSGNITGTVVPVPAAMWLFGSGLLGLVGMARRKKA